MPLEALQPHQRQEVITLLASAFRLSKTAPFIEPSLMKWKYDDPRPGSSTPRSYGWTEDGRIVAHVGLCPLVYRTKDREARAVSLIDWASDGTYPGIGLNLLKELNTCLPMLLVVGGSPVTKRILPRNGFQAAGKLSFYVRVVRPWRQFRTDPFPRGWKAPLRFARNLLRSRVFAVATPANWTCSPTSFTDAGIDSLLEAETEIPSTLRSSDLMKYFLRCPAAAFSAFVLEKDGNRRGWFVLSRVGRVVRIADLRIHRPGSEDWEAAYSLATKAALAEPDICEVVATACIPSAEQALRRNGFRFHHSEPVVLLDPKGLLIGHAPLEVTLFESDGAYITDLHNPYLS